MPVISNPVLKSFLKRENLPDERQREPFRLERFATFHPTEDCFKSRLPVL